jgi:hypothetical protein
MGEESHSPDFRPIPLPGGDGVDGYGYVEGHQSLWDLHQVQEFSASGPNMLS